MENKKVSPLTITDIDLEIWNKFKEQTPRTIKLNDAVIKLIKDAVKKKK